MTKNSLKICLMALMLTSGLSGCSTDRYYASNIEPRPRPVSGASVKWCVEQKCPEYVLDDLTGCEVLSRQTEKRIEINDSTETSTSFDWDKLNPLNWF